MTDKTEWTDACAVDDVPKNDVFAFQVADREIAMYSVDGQVYATDNICTHGHARLCEGFLDGYEIECPLHQGKFDIRSGQPSCAPVTEAIVSYPIKVEAGRVFVEL